MGAACFVGASNAKESKVVGFASRSSEYDFTRVAVEMFCHCRAGLVDGDFGFVTFAICAFCITVFFCKIGEHCLQN